MPRTGMEQSMTRIHVFVTHPDGSYHKGVRALEPVDVSGFTSEQEWSAIYGVLFENNYYRLGPLSEGAGFHDRFGPCRCAVEVKREYEDGTFSVVSP